jgi:hypothetical protein
VPGHRGIEGNEIADQLVRKDNNVSVSVNMQLNESSYCYFNIHDQIKHVQERPKPPTKQDTNNQKKWAIFTYIGRETKFVTKLFRDQNINIAYSTGNT